MKKITAQIRVKKWWLIKNDMFASCNSQYKEGRRDESSWIQVVGETEKAYLLDGMQMHIVNQWCPKSVVLEIREGHYENGWFITADGNKH